MVSTATCLCPWHARLPTPNMRRHVNHRLIGVLHRAKEKKAHIHRDDTKALADKSIHALCFQLNVGNGHVWGKTAHAIGQSCSPAQSVCKEDNLKARRVDIQLFPRIGYTWVVEAQIPKWEIFDFLLVAVYCTIFMESAI